MTDELIACPEAERALLGAALLSHAGVDALHGLTGMDFTDTGCTRVFRAIFELVGGGQPIDPVTVLGQLRRNGDAASVGRSAGVFLHDLVEAAPVPSAASDYRRTVLEHTYRRSVAAAAERWAQLAQHGALLELDDELRGAVEEALLCRARVDAPRLRAVQA